jgi:hypothetical protein
VKRRSVTDDNVRERTIAKPKPMRLHTSAQVLCELAVVSADVHESLGVTSISQAAAKSAAMPTDGLLFLAARSGRHPRLEAR